MVRFQPDSWLEGMLRPFVMMDPQAGIYVEGMAPDLRFALFALFMLTALATRRLQGRVAFAPRQLMLGLFVVLYLWTFVIGNGRYFMAGLLLIGPLLVVSWRLLPGTTRFRWALLVGALALQGFIVSSTYKPNTWGYVSWVDGPSVSLAESPVRQKPAVFLTSTSISFSILVPKFHPDSHWVNVVGQSDIAPGTRDHAALLKLLSGPLAKYLVMPIAADYVVEQQQPQLLVKNVYGGLISSYGLTLAPGLCAVLTSNLAPGEPAPAGSSERLRGFWVCPLAYSDTARDNQSGGPAVSPRLAQVFERIEQHCPRFFPPGSGTFRIDDGLVAKHYSTDTRLLVYGGDTVYLKYFRAVNPTLIGKVDQVLQGDFQVPCEKLPGRYRLPWQSD